MASLHFTIFKRRIHITPSKVFLLIFMLLLVAFTAMPLIYLISTAFKPLEELFAYPPRFFVRNPTFQSFSELLSAVDSSTVPFTRYFFNSVFVTIVSVVATVFICSLATYAMTKLTLPGKNIIFTLIVAAMAFSPPVGQISNYIIINELGMINTYWALIIPKVATASFFFLMKQNMEQIPDALVESAHIDGSSALGIYWKIILPLSKPVIATIIVFSFVANWNDFYSPLIYINKQVLRTLPLALQQLQGGAGQVARSGAMAAASLLTTLPTIVIFVIMQSKVVKTMAHSGIK